MTVTEINHASAEDRQIAEQKRVALSCLAEAWDAARAEGVDLEILAHAALFTAIADLVDIYGEEAVAGLATKLPKRIRAFEFTLRPPVQ